MQGLHLGLEDRVLVLIVSLGAVLSSYGVYILIWRTGYLLLLIVPLSPLQRVQCRMVLVVI